MSRLLSAPAAVIATGLALLAVTTWEAARVPAAPPLGDAERKEVIETVRLFLALTAHLRGSGGDPRFAERLPADPQVTEAILHEIEFLRHAGRQVEPRLLRMDVREVSRSDAEQIVVRTKEYWVTKELGTPDGRARSDVVLARYRLHGSPGNRRIASWEPDEGDDGGPQ